MSHTYKHSESFAKLKSLKEQISTNLTSYQYLSILDDLLFRGIYPIIESTRFVEVFMSQMLGWQTINPKRKTCGVGRHAFSARVTLFLLSDNPKQKLKILRKMRLDRSMLFEILRRWFELASDFQAVSEESPTEASLLKLADLESKCLVKQGHTLTAVYRTSNYWFQQSLDFKTQILEKYTRMCLMTAKRDYEELQHQVPLDDILQIYLLTAGKAIDKCDSERGVLTTHIQNWLLSAKNVVVSTYLQGDGQESRRVNISTTTNKKVVDDLVESASLDDLEELSHSDEDERERRADLQEIRTIAKVFDPQGYGRILLGIREELDHQDRLTLKSLALTDYKGTAPPVNM